MPEILAGWRFGGGRMKSEACLDFLKGLLGEDSARGQWGTHSAKTTVLSWCSKAGMAKEVRKMLGYHVETGDRTMLLYSRDAMAGPIRELERLYKDIGTGAFRPDETRSGRWSVQVPSPMPAASSDAPREDAVEAPFEQDKAKYDENEDSALDEGGTETSEPTDQDGAEADDKSDGEVIGHRQDQFIFNKVKKVLHKKGIVGCTACGYSLTVDRLCVVSEAPAGARLCRHMMCFPYSS